MTYVVVELCVDCKYTDCAAVCPVEAFHELTDRLYINADTCIDCDACVPECPVEAIFADTNVPENYAHWTQINIEEAPKYPIISQKIPALHGPTCTGPEESRDITDDHQLRRAQPHASSFLQVALPLLASLRWSKRVSYVYSYGTRAHGSLQQRLCRTYFATMVYPSS